MYLESDEDDAMETGEDKDESKSPSKSVDTAALSPEPSKFDEPRSPVLSDKKGNHYFSYHLHQTLTHVTSCWYNFKNSFTLFTEDATESSSKADDISSNDKMDSDESKEKPEG